MKERHRIFIAINFPEEIKRVLAGYEKQWHDLPARWTRKENLHVTLVFIGDVYDEAIGEVCMAVKKVVQNYKSFLVHFDKVSYGPKGKSPKMVWLHGQKSKELSSLRAALEDAILAVIPFKPEERAFSPHVTLAKINQMAFRQTDLFERPEIAEDVDLHFEVESIEVMESVLKKGGPEYSVVESMEFGEV